MMEISRRKSVEPACGVGHMAKVLAEYFGEVRPSDIHDYGYGEVRDYLALPCEAGSADWVVTNPPFRLAEEFVHRSLMVARRGVAVLVRTVFLESVGRYEKLFKDKPPAKFAQFTERVAMVKGRLDRRASTATGYAWLVWEKRSSSAPRLVWIPPCRKTLEREGDYDLPPKSCELPKATGIKPSSLPQDDLFGKFMPNGPDLLSARRARVA